MPRNSRRRNRSHFYKYMDAETMLKVLQSARLRWSSPLRFNGPFSPEDITRAVGELLNHYLDAPPDDLTDFESLATLLTLAKGGLERPGMRGSAPNKSLKPHPLRGSA